MTTQCDGPSTKKSRVRSKTRTFPRKVLEADFLLYCQLSTETSDAPGTSAEFNSVLEEAQEHVPNDEFVSRGAASRILGDDLLDACAPAEERPQRKVTSLPTHLASLCEDRLLTPEQEKQLFRRMNYLRYLAWKIMVDSSPESIGQWDLERAKGLLRAAEWHRDVIVKANIRLVISIVKKFSNPQCSFDDLLSDGIMALIRSVDKFDYQLGYRFSTYATQVVRRNSYRFVMDRQDERLRISNSVHENGLDIEEDEYGAVVSEQRWEALQAKLKQLLFQLDKRERLIIRARFSLGGFRRVQTLQRLADKLGISKERVRQLEKRALEKLQGMAAESPIETQWEAVSA